MSQEELAVSDLVYDVALISSAGGVINQILGDYPVSSPDWASFILLYGEYRILSMKVQFVPTVTGAVIGTLAYNTLYLVLDLTSSATALSSYTSAANYPVKKIGSLNSPMQLSHKMVGIEESTFTSTGASLFDYVFKFYADTLTATTTYGHVIVTFHTQFRARQ
jgi:hypothetical protein